MLEPGELYYNGFWFPGAITSSVKASPVYDSTQRVKKYQRYEITVECIIYPGVDERPSASYHPSAPAPTTYTPFFPALAPDIDGSLVAFAFPGMQELRRALQTPGGLLFFRDKGIGTDFIVCGEAKPSAYLDVEFGPKPQVLAWESLGGNKAARIVWTVVATFGDCPKGLAAGITSLITEYSWEANWAIDSRGATTRTINGILEVAVARVGNRVRNSADQYRSKILFPITVGFSREQQFRLSPDRRTLAFSITDTEIPSERAYPYGITEIDVDVQTQSTAAGKTIMTDRWQVTVSGRIAVRQGLSIAHAWRAAVSIIKSRREAAKNARVSSSASDMTKEEQQSAIRTAMLTTSMTITEHLYSNAISFSISWELWCGLKTLFDATGLLNPEMDKGNWYVWHQSMAAAFAPRGVANITHKAAADVIVTMCDGTQPTILGDTPIAHDSAKDNNVFGSDCPSPEASWIDIQINAELIEENRQIRHLPMVGRQPSPMAEVQPGSLVNGVQGGSTSSGTAHPFPNRGGAIVQTLSQPYYRVRFSGWALRMGYEVPKIELREYGRRRATPVSDYKFSQRPIMKTEGCRLYLAKWSCEYSLEEKPDSELIVTSPDVRKFAQ